MRFVLVTLIALSALSVFACHSDPAPRTNRAVAFLRAAADVANVKADKVSCSDWGTGSADVAWCKVDTAWLYCTAGDARWEKDPSGKWENLGEPSCVTKTAPPAPPPAAAQQPPATAPAPAPAAPVAPQPPAAGSGVHP